MSARKRRRFALSDDATLGLEDVLLSTQERRGAERRRRYRSRLFQAMRSLPELGRSRDDPFAGCRGLAIEAPVIVDRIADDAIAVGRIPHASQHPTGKVGP
jgi:plasmid stabilization system protein ParE